MTLSVETIIVVALMMAVFAAVSTIGSSLYLGAGYERLRAGFETVKKQTAFFSDAIAKLDTRVDSVEKQGSYFFQAITDLERKAERQEPASSPLANVGMNAEKLICSSRDDALHTGADNLLNGMGFVAQPDARRELMDMFRNKAGQSLENRPHFH